MKQIKGKNWKNLGRKKKLTGMSGKDMEVHEERKNENEAKNKKGVVVWVWLDGENSSNITNRLIEDWTPLEYERRQLDGSTRRRNLVNLGEATGISHRPEITR